MATWSYNRRWWVHSGERLVHVNRGSLYLIGTMMPITVWASRVLHRNEHIYRNIDLLSSDFFSRRWGYKRGLKARKFPTRTSFPCSMFGVIFWKTAISTKNGRRMFLGTDRKKQDLEIILRIFFRVFIHFLNSSIIWFQQIFWILILQVWRRRYQENPTIARRKQSRFKGGEENFRIRLIFLNLA